MKQRYFYDHGLPFSTKLGENIIDLDTRVRKKFASLIVIDGGIGQGKTTKGVHIADYINGLHGLPKIDLIKGEQIAMGGADFAKKLRICFEKKYPAIVYDEAGDFNKRGSLTKFNRMINRVFETFRAFKTVVILCLPSFAVLDQDLFDKQIPRLLLHLTGRGDTYGNFGGYSLYRMLLLRGRMSKMNIKNFAFTMIDPNFRGHFLDLEKRRSNQLDKLSTKSKIDILKKSEIEIEGLLSYSQLATRLMRSIRWVKQAASNLKLKPNRMIKRAKYFDEQALNILAEHLDTLLDTRTKGIKK